MKLGVNLVHDCAVDLARAAEALGYDVALAPEGYRSDAPSVLGGVATATARIGLASGVMQIPARSPALAALTAATLDELSGGRFRLGLGVSNPDVSEGWYGEPFARPLERTREYVEIVRATLRQESVTYQGRHYRLPAGDGATPLRLSVPPLRPDLPVYLASVGPRSLELAGEIADGWIGMFVSPERVAEAVTLIGRGRRRGGRDGAFEVLPCAPVSVDADPERAADALRPHVGHLLSLGSVERNVYCQLATEMGFGAEMALIHECRKRGDFAGLAAAVPFHFVDQVALVGPVERIADRLAAYADSGVTTMGIMVSSAATSAAGRLRLLREAATALDRSGRG